MSKRLEHVEAAKVEAIKLGATFNFYRNSGNHLIAIICLGNKSRKISLSGSPSRRCCYDAMRDVRRAIREMT